ncbi:MAG: TetR/AcrR family transcriptional regulator [Ilumatobacteraceae bacterium]|jgi:AcrR family transcriptional regulator
MATPHSSTPPPRPAGARARAHAEVRGAILATASAHLAEHGAADLSLRAVARDLGMVSSAMYRYFASRDELLTALIVEAYDSLGEHAEAAVAASAGSPPAERWVTTAAAIRGWAFAHPHDYALLYGTPIPGYAAPDDTVVPGTRVSRALVTIVRDAATDGLLGPPAPGTSISTTTAESFEALRDELALGAVGDDTLLVLLLAWTQLFGLLTFELFGQTRNFVHDDEQLFVDAAATMARNLGLA